MIPPSAHTAEFEKHRPLLLGMAYRMLGSMSDAEDMVQETWLRWREARDIQSPRSWLVRVISRLCLDRLKSARLQREHYYGTWLPEPWVDPQPPRDDVVDESLSIALLLLLEKLSPAERVGFLLHEVFGYDFAEIADILGKSEVACRKLVSRARNRIHSGKPRFPVTRSEHEVVLQRFLEACRQGDIQPILNLFGENLAFYSDGGGKAIAVPKVLTDPEVIARFFAHILRNLEKENLAIVSTHFNGTPGVLFFINGQLVTALSLEVRQGKIVSIFGHRNPDKLCLFVKP